MIRAELDLQVNLAREHAARLGVNNRGVEGMLKRANLIYGTFIFNFTIQVLLLLPWYNQGLYMI